MTGTKNYILTKAIAEKKMLRMAYEILENNAGETEIILAGIRESGSIVARNIQQLLQKISNINADVVTVSLDKKNPREVMLSKPIDFTGKILILVDDVTNTGKTLLYALKPFLAYQPKKIQTLVLVERSHKIFPIHPDYTGISIATAPEEYIHVEVEGENVKGAYIK
ncbi:MAG: phosphoribosyltransferase family protein [Chitinophagaceae bacterium]|nr:phosphoribosyltransferase family protein [Chitinophagaceae bacterium]